MKDPKGHGSDAGLHSTRINNLPAKMTRAHFEVIAKMLADQGKMIDDSYAKNPSHFSSQEADRKAHSDTVSAYADKLSTTNPGFNRQKFIEAASGKGGGRSRQVSLDNASRQIFRAGARGRK